MKVPLKPGWTVRASSGDPRLAVDDQYATAWTATASKALWLEIDLGVVATLGGLEVYWGRQAPAAYDFAASLNAKDWTRICGTSHGEGGQDVFAFLAVEARFVRWTCRRSQRDPAPEIVEINLYSPSDAASVREAGGIGALGQAPVRLLPGESVTVDFGYERSPLGALVAWGQTYATDFSAHLSDDGVNFREVGRIATGDGGSDSFYWRSTHSRYFRLSVHATNSPEGAVVEELKLRILNKDRMPIGQLERAAVAGRGELYPQSLLGRQVYWTAIGEFDHGDEALFDEYGNLEPRRGFPQIMPLLRLGGVLHGAPGSPSIKQSLLDGALPIPTVVWSALDLELQVTALDDRGQAIVEYRAVNRSRARKAGSLVLAVRPVQINPYWQHGGHARIDAIAVKGRRLSVNDRTYAVFSSEPDAVAVADFDNGDVIRLIEKRRRRTWKSLRSNSGLLSAACEFAFSLPPGGSAVFVVSAPMREDVSPRASADFSRSRTAVARAWREKIGPRKITVGDREVSDTVEAQTALILVNAAGPAFRPGPRNYDRTWIRDGSAQALALLWAGQIEDAKTYVLWYAKRVERGGMVPPILNVDGSVNRGYGSNIEFDAQGEFVGIAADVYRITKDRKFLKRVFATVVRATRFLEDLCARTNARHGPETRFHGLVAPSISHEGYNKPSFSYWDDYFALSAWRNCEWLATEIGDTDVAAHAHAKGNEFAANLTRSIRMTAAAMGRSVIPSSADRNDVDPHGTAIAFEPCQVEDVLPGELAQATFDLTVKLIEKIRAPGFEGNYAPYILRDLNAFVALGRLDDAFALLSTVLKDRRPPGWRGWAEVVWSDPRVADYIGDMPHTWIGAEFATAIRRMLLRENGDTLQLFRAVPDNWWAGEAITLRDLPTGFGLANLTVQSSQSNATIELSLTGPAPSRITFRYPGAKRALADGAPCEIRGDVVYAPNWNRLVVEF